MTQVILSMAMTTGEDYAAKRTWKERLFTLPWRPWAATEIRTRYAPSEQVLKLFLGDGRAAVVLHPAAYATLKKLGAVPSDWEV